MGKMAEIQNEMLRLGVYALVVRGEGSDFLMGTNVKDYVKLAGLEGLLQHFILDLDRAFLFIYDEDIAGYLNFLEDKFHLDLTSLQANLEANIFAMKQSESDDIMIYYLVITKTLEHLRSEIFTTVGWEVIQKIYETLHGTAATKKMFASLNDLPDQESSDVSLLYNLIFTHFLAEHYHEAPVLAACRALIEEALKRMG
ncbi:MAG: hypothetical protein ACTSWW_08670 [Promethearchaeota archaeon]